MQSSCRFSNERRYTISGDESTWFKRPHEILTLPNGAGASPVDLPDETF